jgi:hypothetical protein
MSVAPQPSNHDPDDAARRAERRREELLSDAEMSRLLDGVLGADLRPRPRQGVDVTATVLRSLGYVRAEPREELRARRARRRRRHGGRLAQVLLLAASAIMGVALHNRSPDAVRVDGAIPRAVDRAIHSIQPASGSPAAATDRGESEAALERLLERLDGGREHGFGGGATWPAEPAPSAAPTSAPDAGRDGGSKGGPGGAGTEDQTPPGKRAAAPYRWVCRPSASDSPGLAGEPRVATPRAAVSHEPAISMIVVA